MGKDKLKRFTELNTLDRVIQPSFEEMFRKEYKLKGHWREEVFHNQNPVIIELGCGRGEYTVAMGRMFPDKNFIGIDIKGARMWRGAKTANEENLTNVAFLRTRIEFINSFFAQNEIDEIWITFPDPQLDKKRIKKRLTSPAFLNMYALFLKPDGLVHLKTDCRHLHEYTKAVVAGNNLDLFECCTDIYGTDGYADELLSVKTTYEARFLAEGFDITYMRFGLAGKNQLENIDFPPDEEL